MGRLTHDTGQGWSYFVTTKAWQSTFLFQMEETAKIIVTKILEYRDKGHYLLHDFVLMPNHLHLILTPATSVSLEKAMQLIKGGSSHEIHKVRGRNLEIWQSGFHESRVTSWTDYQRKRDYVLFNPVAAKLVDRPEAWVFGSASGRFALDPIPQGLKPVIAPHINVGPEGPTPGALTSRERTGERTGPQGRCAPWAEAQGLPELNVGAEGPTPGALTSRERTGERTVPEGRCAPWAEAQGLPELNVGAEAPTPAAPTIGTVVNEEGKR